MRLSEVLEDLKKVAEIGALRYSRWQSTHDKKCVNTLQNFYEDLYPENPKGEDFNSMDEYGEFHKQWVDETFHWIKLSRCEQALIIAALEQYADSKGYWFTFYRRTNLAHKVRLNKFPTNKGDEPIWGSWEIASTRLQAALKVFIAVFGSGELK